MEEVRKEFPIFETHPSFVYLDTAATSHKPKVVVDALSRFFLEEYGTVHRAVYELAAGATDRYNAVREQVKEFIGAREEGEVIFTRGTTDGINLVASCFGAAFLEEGDEIIISETEHHSNIVPWQMICKQKKAQLKVIPVDDQGKILLDVYEKMLSSKTKLVAIASIANATGVVHPISKIIELAHAKGAKVLVDAAQSISHLPIAVQSLDVDFLVFSSHKMYGPTGVGILYAKKELLEKMPPYQGGGDMVDRVSFEKTTYQKAPLKFEAGTPSIAEVMGLGAAIGFLQRIGLAQIHSHEIGLKQVLRGELKKIPELILIGPDDHPSSIVSFYIKDVHSLDVGTLLDLRGIAVRTGHLCAQPALKRFGVQSLIRASFGIYNKPEEIDRFVASLREVLKILL